MSDLGGVFKAFTAAEIEMSHLKFPVTAQLMDISMVPFIELVALSKDEFGIYDFEKKLLPGTLSKQGPHTVRFSVEGMEPYLKDFPWQVNG
jgi:hypothetical protein